MHPSEHCSPLIRQINCTVEKRINNELRASDLTHAQICLIFSLIEKEDGCCSMKKMEQHLRVAQSTTAGIVKRSEEKGLVECIPDPEDRRSKSVRICPKGMELYRETRENIRATEAWLLSGLSPEEQVQFRTLLSKVRNHLCAK